MPRLVDSKILVQLVILFCQQKGTTINPLKLQKLLYYIQAWHIVFFKKSPLFDELPEAWVNGPVYRSIYNQFKTKFFRNDNFAVKCSENMLEDKINETISSLNITSNQLKLIFGVLTNYCVMSDEKLVFLTHNEKPWNMARKGLSPISRSDQTISIDNMFNYYSSRVKS